MLTMKKIIATALLACFFFAACEKDDICDPSTSTTPRLVVQFFDNNNVSLTRSTPNLRIIDDGFAENGENNPLLNQNGGATWNDTVAYIPLRLNQNTTKYRLILNANDNNPDNDRTDILEFNYTKSEVYISRACGFKALFDLLGNPLQQPIILNNNPDAIEGTWIRKIELIQSQINDENEAHVKIFF